MATQKLSSREKIVKSAVALFLEQGITATTTKQIAERAGVNEVTLFRQFGSKHGLLLAVLEEAPIVENMQAALADIIGASEPVMAYGALGLELLGNASELVRSLIGESGQAPAENLQALGQTLCQANRQTVAYLQASSVNLPSGLSIEASASLLNMLVIGRAVMDFTSGGHGIRQSQEDFLAATTALFLAAGEIDAVEENDLPGEAVGTEIVADLPAETVRSLFQKAKKLGPQEHALVYVLFGAGLRIEEAVKLLRSHSLSSKTQHLLTITRPNSQQISRQVPLNRWIMGNRYGTYLKNPLTQWLKSRQDEQPEMFVDTDNNPLDTDGILELWNTIAADTLTITGQPATPFHARQTWCIELLMKGMSLENLSILSGFSPAALEVYAKRAKEKTALEQALAIDQKSS